MLSDQKRLSQWYQMILARHREQKVHGESRTIDVGQFCTAIRLTHVPFEINSVIHHQKEKFDA